MPDSTSARFHLVNWPPVNSNQFSGRKVETHTSCSIHRVLISEVKKSCQTRRNKSRCIWGAWSVLQPPPWLHSCGCFHSAEPFTGLLQIHMKNNRLVTCLEKNRICNRSVILHPTLQDILQYFVLLGNITMGWKRWRWAPRPVVAKVLCVFPAYKVPCPSTLGCCTWQVLRARGRSSPCVQGTLYFSLFWLNFG